MQTFWLDILEHKSTQISAPSTYTLSRADASGPHAEIGSLPTVYYPSWGPLVEKLSEVGVDITTLLPGDHTDIRASLTENQLTGLGFTENEKHKASPASHSDDILDE